MLSSSCINIFQDHYDSQTLEIENTSTNKFIPLDLDPSYKRRQNRKMEEFEIDFEKIKEEIHGDFNLFREKNNEIKIQEIISKKQNNNENQILNILQIQIQNSVKNQTNIPKDLIEYQSQIPIKYQNQLSLQQSSIELIDIKATRMFKNGLSIKQVAKSLKLPFSLVRKIKQCNRIKPGRKMIDPQMQQYLFTWLRRTFKKHSKIEKLLIRQKALSFSSVQTFMASKGWCQRFLHRYSLKNYYELI